MLADYTREKVFPVLRGAEDCGTQSKWRQWGRRGTNDCAAVTWRPSVRDVALGDREEERKTSLESAEGQDPSDRGALVQSASLWSSEAAHAPGTRCGCWQTLPPQPPTRTVDAEFTQYRALCLNISAPQCRAHRGVRGPCSAGGSLQELLPTGPLPPALAEGITLGPRVGGGPGWASSS